jgi:hypothetical protein
MGILATTDVVADMAILATSDIVTDMNVLGTSANVTAMGLLGVSAVVTDMGILGTSDVVADMALLGTSANVSAMDVIGTSTVVANIATVAANVAGVNSFAERYRVGSSNPTSDLNEGDLFYNTSSNVVLFYNGSAWITIVAGNVTQTGSETLTNKTLTLPKINENVALTSTATELNLLDGVSGLVQADLTKLAAIDATAAEIDTLDALSRGSIIYGNASAATAILTKGSANTVLTSDGTDIAWSAVDAGVAWQSSIVTASTITVVAGRAYWINTTSNACTITLPSSASVGDQLIFTDYARTWGTNAVTINQNGLKFQGGTDNPVYDTLGQSVDLVYSGATKGWIPNSDDVVVNEGVIPTVDVEYLVLA